MYNKYVKIKEEKIFMKKKELKQLAKKIAEAENNIKNNINVEESKQFIMRLTSQVDIEYLDQLDELIQEYL